MRQAVAAVVVMFAVLACAGCEQVQGLMKKMEAPGGFPDNLKGLMSKSVPLDSKRRVTYPRLAVALTNTRETREVAVGMADCGHFKVTEWQSETIKQYLEFDACITRQDEQQVYNLGNTESVAYMLNPHAQWVVVEKYNGNRGKDYQPMGTHWSEGPQVAQFFVPPAWIDPQKTASQINMIEAFLAHVGVYGTDVDPRTWFYQVDQSN